MSFMQALSLRRRYLIACSSLFAGTLTDGDFTCSTVQAFIVRRKVFVLDTLTGRMDLWKELAPSDPAGIVAIYSTQIAADGKTYGYSSNRILSDLYLVRGLK